MKKFYLVSSLFLATTCMINFSALKAEPFLLKEDEDIASISTRSTFIKDKIKKEIDNARLSDKGDLSTDIPDEALRRRFFTTGDGDCFFWATDLIRQNVRNQLLANSGNEALRRLALEEIYDEYMEDIKDDPDRTPFPQVMKNNDLYRNFKAELELTQSWINDPSNASMRHDLIAAQDLIKQRVKDEYCLNEGVYRDYITHCLSRQDQFLLYPQEVGGNARTYFVDAIIGGLLRKNLIVWAYNHDNTSLIKAHEYIADPNAETLEVLHESNHYTRIVPVDNQATLNHARNKEDEYLDNYKKRKKNYINEKIKINILSLHKDFQQRMNGSNAFSQDEKNAQQNRAMGKVKVTPRDRYNINSSKPAFYKALRMFDLKKAETINKEIQNIEGFNLAGRQAELPGLRQQLSLLTNKIDFYDRILTELNANPPIEEVADMLLQLSLFHGHQEKNAQKNNAAAQERDSHDLKVKFGEAFDSLKNALTRDISFQTRSKFRAAQEKLQNNLAKRIPLNTGYPINNSNFTDAYNLAKNVVDAHLANIRRQDPTAKYLNPAYLCADPFLGKDEIDINTLYPDDISDLDLAKMRLLLQKNILQKLVSADSFATITAEVDNFCNNGTIDNTLIPVFVSRISGQRISEWQYTQNLQTCELRFAEKDRDGAYRLDRTGQIRYRGPRINFLSPEEIAATNALITDVLTQAFFGLTLVFENLEIDNFDNGAMTNQKNLVRKRFQRIIDKNIEQAVNEHGDNEVAKSKGRLQAALIFAQHQGRCIDGISEAVDNIENELSNYSPSAETEISNIIADYVLKFYEKFASLRPGDSEWATSSSQFIKQRLFFALPNKGVPRTSFYALIQRVGQEGNTLFAPQNLMSKFLEGGSVNYSYQSLAGPVTNTVTFEKYDYKKLIDLVYDAYLRGKGDHPSGKILSTENILDLIQRDESLQTMYEEFNDDVFNEVPQPRHSQFFQVISSSEDNEFKRAFFELLLEKLGYIIAPHGSPYGSPVVNPVNNTVVNNTPVHPVNNNPVHPVNNTPVHPVNNIAAITPPVNSRVVKLPVVPTTPLSATASKKKASSKPIPVKVAKKVTPRAKANTPVKAAKIAPKMTANTPVKAAKVAPKVTANTPVKTTKVAPKKIANTPVKVAKVAPKTTKVATKTAVKKTSPTVKASKATVKKGSPKVTRSVKKVSPKKTQKIRKKVVNKKNRSIKTKRRTNRK